MYHSGEDLGVVVCDPGSYCMRVGFAGEDYPRYYSPSVVGLSNSGDAHKNHFEVSSVIDDVSLEPCIRDGLVCDWDLFEQQLRHSLTGPVKTDPREAPLLITEKSFNPQASRNKTCELAFESLECPAFFLAKDAAMVCYACGRSGGLVVDCGASGTHISPVIDGWVESRAVTQSPVGARLLDEYALHLLQTRVAQQWPDEPALPAYRVTRVFPSQDALLGGIAPTYRINDRPKVHSTFDRFMRHEMGRAYRECLARVAEGPLTELAARYAAIPTASYELPDGRIIDVGIERYEISETFFDPSMIPSRIASTFEASTNKNAESYSSSGISSSKDMWKSVPRLVVDSVTQCEGESGVQASLLGGLVVAGGAGAVEGFPERLRYEVELLTRGVVAGWKVKVQPSAPTDRATAAWLGGSIVGSLGGGGVSGGFSELWVSRKEYQEYGASVVDKKCP